MDDDNWCITNSNKYARKNLAHPSIIIPVRNSHKTLFHPPQHKMTTIISIYHLGLEFLVVSRLLVGPFIHSAANLRMLHLGLPNERL
jgi:hypothetical protein